MSKYNIILGERGKIISALNDKKLNLIKEKKSYERAVKKFSNYMDILEGLNAFIVKNLKDNAKYADWQKRIIDLEIQAGVDSLEYKKLIDEVYQTEINRIQSVIDSFVSNNSKIDSRINFYSSEIAKLIAEIKDICESDGIAFSYSPISHTSQKIKTIWSQIHEAVEAEYAKGTYEDNDKNGTIANEISDALLKENADKVSKASDFANGDQYKFETEVNGKSADYVKDGIIDDKDISYLKSKSEYASTEEYAGLSDEDKKAFNDSYDLTGDNKVDSEDVTKAEEIKMKKSDVEENQGAAFSSVSTSTDDTGSSTITLPVDENTTASEENGGF